MLEADNLFPDNWIYIHTPGVKVGRIQNFNNWSAAMVPTPGTTCLGMEYFCFEGDGLWTAADADLIELAARELEQLGLAEASGCRRRHGRPDAEGLSRSTTRTYRDHLDVVREYIDPIPNLHTVGRNGMHKYNNQDHSMFTAMMAVENMQGAVARHLGGQHRLRVPRGAATAAPSGVQGDGPAPPTRDGPPSPAPRPSAEASSSDPQYHPFIPRHGVAPSSGSTVACSARNGLAVAGEMMHTRVGT